MDDQERHPAVMRTIIAVLRLADDDPQAAPVALAPVIAGSVPEGHPIWLVEALLLEAIARYMPGDAAAAQCPIGRVPDLAEPDRMLFHSHIHPAPGLLERHVRQRTADAALSADILSWLAGTSPPGGGQPRRAAQPGRDPCPALPADPPSRSGD